MGKITFILGGSRSGKSAYALELAKKKGKKAAFIATAQPLDSEMRKRIQRHKLSRPKHWKTFEEFESPENLLKKISSKFDVALIDCLTLMASNFMHNGLSQEAIENKIKKMLLFIKDSRLEAVIVSNEVGLGIVPDNKLARNFRDLAGKLNQLVAKEANEVFFLLSGLPWRIK